MTAEEFAIIIDEKSVKRQLRAMQIKYNRGRKKKVSIRRPSPQLSTLDWFAMQSQARINVLAEKYLN